MKRLPIGEQSFENLRADDNVYVDKTTYIHALIMSGGRYKFLSRPRRFGKSLLLTTTQAVFEGKKELFEGLYIYDKIDWEERHLVILLDMSLKSKSITSLEEGIIAQLSVLIKKYDLDIQFKEPAIIFSELIRLLHEKTGKQVVVLIDEYDKPILDAMDDMERASQMRSFLQNFYSVLKSSAPHLRFVFLTGVSKISQTSIFSGLNNLDDITMDPKYAGICGYTQPELEASFDDYIIQLSDKKRKDRPAILQDIKRWYDGYSWDGETFVYNPFSVLKLFSKNIFAPHWFATGTPSFLIKLLQHKNDFSPVLASNIIVNAGFDDKQTLENMLVIPLCFQTGYLTVKKFFVEKDEYELQIPNEEVRVSLMESIITNMINLPEADIQHVARQLYTAFEKNDMPLAMEYLRTIYSNASYHQGIDNEGYYHNIFEIIAKFSGMDIITESRTDTSRVDCVLKFANRTYVVEIKHSLNEEQLAAKATTALEQIKDKKYYQPWVHQGKEVHLLGLAFMKGGVEYREEVM